MDDHPLLLAEGQERLEVGAAGGVGAVGEQDELLVSPPATKVPDRRGGRPEEGRPPSAARGSTSTLAVVKSEVQGQTEYTASLKARIRTARLGPPKPARKASMPRFAAARGAPAVDREMSSARTT